MTLTEQELKAIEREAETYSKNKISGWGGVYSVSPKHYMKTGFIEGVKQERIKSKKLLEALQEVKKECPVGSWFEKTITKAIKEYGVEK